MAERWRYIWYELLYYPAAFLAFALFSLRVRGKARVPQTGPLLLVANHQCAIDPVLVGIAARRHVNYLARRTLFKHRFGSWLMESLGAVRLSQESGTEGLKATLALLKEGRGVVLFPEGARTEDGAVHDLKPGILLLLKRAQATVVPVGIAGAFEAWPIWSKLPRAYCPFFLPAGKGGIGIAVGEPFASSALTGMPGEQALAELKQKLTTLREEAEKLRRK